MKSSGKSSYAHRFDAVKFPFKFAMAALLLGTVPLAGAQNIQTIYSFSGTNGEWPNALTLGNDGNFYGTTAYGGNNGDGTCFQLTTNGTVNTLASFSGGSDQFPSGLTLGNDGNFYGMTEYGGSDGDGSFFEFTPAGTLTTLYSFTDGNDGVYPTANLTLGNDGTFYGTAPGGHWGYGTIFRVTTAGTLTTLYSFTNGSDGEYPTAALTLGNDGNFYGSTAEGGIKSSTFPNGMGTIFQVTTNGQLTTLVSFSSSIGAIPESALTLGNDGSFYSATEYSGSGGPGSFFKVTTNGTLTMFSTSTNNGVYALKAALTLGDDGNFYGTAFEGDNGAHGTVFQLATNGTLTTFASFSFAAYPSGLTMGTDGNFYGTTGESTNKGLYGTVFRLSLSPAITFQPQSQTNNAGATVTFSVNATSLYPMAYQWLKNGTNLLNGGNISGATTNMLTITHISDTDAANYSVILTNAKGSDCSSCATLTVIDPPTITTQPTNLLVLAGNNATFTFSLTGSAPFCYQWQCTSTNLLNATNPAYTIPSVGTNNAGLYSVVVSNAAGCVTSSTAVLTVVLSPTSRTNYASSTATFTVTAITPESLSFQWQKNGVNLTNGATISGTTTSTLTIASVLDVDAANYSALVSDCYANVTTSNALLTVNDSLVFATQPLSQITGAGSTVTFTAAAYGAPPFVFQWLFAQNRIGSPTTGSNFSSITLTNVGTNQAGNYCVEVFNGSGSLTSSNAALTVIAQPTLALQILAGYPLLTLHGTLAANFTVQYNTNLAYTNWMNLLSLTNLSTSPYQFLDPSGVGQPARFYRAFFSQ